MEGAHELEKAIPLTKIRVAKMETQVSAGGVLFRRAGGIIEVALIGLKGGSVWALLKGRVEKGEDLEVTATREVARDLLIQSRCLEALSLAGAKAIRTWDGQELPISDEAQLLVIEALVRIGDGRAVEVIGPITSPPKGCVAGGGSKKRLKSSWRWRKGEVKLGRFNDLLLTVERVF